MLPVGGTSADEGAAIVVERVKVRIVRIKLRGFLDSICCVDRLVRGIISSSTVGRAHENAHFYSLSLIHI